MKIKKLFTIISLFILIQPLVPAINHFSKVLALENSIFTTDNVFTNQTVLNGHNRRFVAVGNFYDVTDGNYYVNSEAYLKFDLSSIPTGSIIDSAQLSLRRYGNGGEGFNAYVAKLGQAFDSTTGSNVNDYKSFSGNYDSEFIDDGDLDFRDYRWTITNLVQEWTSGAANNGLAIIADNPAELSGAAFCSSRADGFCLPEYAPRLIINYTTNNPPNTPNLVAPINLSEISGGCDESLGIGFCRTSLPVTLTVDGVGDPDDNLELTQFEVYNSTNGASQIFSATGNGSVSNQINLVDGNYIWKARSLDNLNTFGNYSIESQFTLDSTPPEVPEIQNLRPFTNALQFTINTNHVVDNLSSNVQYFLEYSNNSSFVGAFQKPWQQNNSFQIGEFGADGIQNTSDDLINNQTYYFRIKAKDSLNNISAWSQISSTTIDNTIPAVTNFNYTVDGIEQFGRFSPNNSTSVGEFDSVEFSFEYEEENPKEARLIMQDLANQLVRNQDQDLTLNSELQTLNFVWDGKDSNGNFLPDGAYKIKAQIEDEAGNIGESNESIIIIDNTAANVSISSPTLNAWTNEDSININGQLANPNNPNLEDSDIVKFELSNDNGQNWQEIIFPESGIFEIPSELSILNLGENKFLFRTVDSVGNIQTQIYNPRTSEYKDELIVTKENTTPAISEIQPNALINSQQPLISFTIQDDIDENGHASDIAIGVNPHWANLNLEYRIWNVEQGNYEDVVLELFENGVKLQSTLTSDITCQAIPEATLSLKNERESANFANCSFDFISPLEPDGEYRIVVGGSDNAGNQVESSQTFELDSNIYSEILTPNSNVTSPNSVVEFKGKASIGSQLQITNYELLEERSFVINQGLNGTGEDGEFIMSDFEVICGIFEDIDGRQDTKNEELCEWTVNIKQDSTNEEAVISNINRLVVLDEAENSKSHEVIVNVDLYSLDLNISTDLNYFSPNSDGNQDFVTFTHFINYSEENFASLSVESYDLAIMTTSGEIVKSFPGIDILTSETIWDGRNNQGQTVEDGEYVYTLTLMSEDGIQYISDPKSIYSIKEIQDEVVLTTPVDGFVTTDGVINVQGQAPSSQNINGFLNLLRGSVRVEICVDSLQTDIACDERYFVPVSELGFFSTIAILPREKLDRAYYRITAKAFDIFGNATPDSNIVNVILDTADPFNYVSIAPTLSGITNPQDYERFLNGEININEIRSVRLNSNVTQFTEQVELSFAEFTNLQSIPSNYDYRLVGTLTNEVEESRILNVESSNEIKKLNVMPLGHTDIPYNVCEEPAGCNWTYNLPIDARFGGVYEINFKGKKGSIIQELTGGFKVDGTIPAEPIVMIVEKYDNGNWKTLNQTNQKYYSNHNKLRLRGAAEPNTELSIVIEGQTFTTTDVLASGIWEKEIDLGLLIGDLSEKDFEIKLLSSDGNNEVLSSQIINIKYDVQVPQLTSISRSTGSENITGWTQTGGVADFKLYANEELRYSDIVKEDNFKMLMNRTTDFSWIGSINIDAINIFRQPREGYYYPKVQLVDLAGNSFIYDSMLWERYGLGDFRIYVDNTKPEKTEIDTSTWSSSWDEGGVNAHGVNPEVGRLNPGYVTKSNTVNLSGQAEKGQRVEIWVNSQRVSVSEVTNQNCSGTGEDKVSESGLVVKSGEICLWTYTYSFPGDGKANLSGNPTEGYLIQVRTKDNAANVSNFSEQILIYHDTQFPGKPNASLL